MLRSCSDDKGFLANNSVFGTCAPPVNTNARITHTPNAIAISPATLATLAQCVYHFGNFMTSPSSTLPRDESLYEFGRRCHSDRCCRSSPGQCPHLKVEDYWPAGQRLP